MPPPSCSTIELGEVDVLDAEAQVRLVVAVAAHRLSSNVMRGKLPLRVALVQVDAEHLLPDA